MSETSEKRLIFRWTAPKGFAALVAFLALAFFFEFLLVYSFQLFGLTDRQAWAGAFLIPGVNFAFRLSVSPLFHLLPLSVLIVLLSSWAYLTKYTAVVPSRPELARRSIPATRREFGKQRFRGWSRFSKGISRRLQRFGHSLKAGFQRIRGVSYISRRLHFARAAVRSAITVILVFISMSLLLYVVVYPDIGYQVVLRLYMGNPSFLGFVKAATDFTKGVGQALPPLGSVGTAINNALLGAAPNFRRGLGEVGTALTGPIVALDVVGKYVLSQTVAAWISAFVALIYGSYSSTRRVRRVTRR